MFLGPPIDVYTSNGIQEPLNPTALIIVPSPRINARGLPIKGHKQANKKNRSSKISSSIISLVLALHYADRASSIQIKVNIELFVLFYPLLIYIFVERSSKFSHREVIPIGCFVCSFFLPGKDTVLVLEGTSGSIIGEGSEIDGRLSTNINRLRSRVVVDISGGVSRISSVDLNVELSERLGVGDSDHVERGLGSMISGGVHGIPRRSLVAGELERSQAAGDIDDATRLGLFDELEEGENCANNTKEVDGESLLDLGKRLLDGRFSKGSGVDTSIIHQNIEGSDLLSKCFSSDLNTLIGSDINDQQVNVRVTSGTKFIDRLLATRLIASTDKDLISTSSKLASNFLTDTLVGTSDQSGFLVLNQNKQKILSTLEKILLYRQ